MRRIYTPDGSQYRLILTSNDVKEAGVRAGDLHDLSARARASNKSGGWAIDFSTLTKVVSPGDLAAADVIEYTFPAGLASANPMHVYRSTLFDRRGMTLGQPRLYRYRDATFAACGIEDAYYMLTEHECDTATTVDQFLSRAPGFGYYTLEQKFKEDPFEFTHRLQAHDWLELPLHTLGPVPAFEGLITEARALEATPLHEDGKISIGLLAHQWETIIPRGWYYTDN